MQRSDKRIRTQLLTVQNLLDGYLQRLAGYGDTVPPPGMVDAVLGLARTQRELVQTIRPKRMTADVAEADLDKPPKVAPAKIYEHDGARYVRISLDDWRCPACDSAVSLKVTDQVTGAVFRPLVDQAFCLADAPIRCGVCEWQGTTTDVATWLQGD